MRRRPSPASRAAGPLRGTVLAWEDIDSAATGRWAELAARALEPNPFFEPRFLMPAWRHLGSGGDVALLVVSRGREWLLAMPLRRRRVHRVPLAALTTWRHDYCYLGTPLVTAEDPEGALHAGLQRLVSMSRAPWLALEQLPVDGPVAGALATALRGRPCARIEPFARPVVRRRAEATYTEGRLPAGRRKELRRQRRTLERALGGPVGVEDLAESPGWEDVEGAVEGFLGMEASGWKGRDGGAFARRPGHAAFFRDVCLRYHEAGRLQLFRLGNDQRAAARQCNLLAGRTVFHFKTAYDEELGRHSPGVQLELAMIDAFHADHRLDTLDSCITEDGSVSERLYPDRRRLATTLVALSGLAGRGLVRLVPPAVRAHRRGNGGGRATARRLGAR